MSKRVLLTFRNVFRRCREKRVYGHCFLNVYDYNMIRTLANLIATASFRAYEATSSVTAVSRLIGLNSGKGDFISAPSSEAVTVASSLAVRAVRHVAR